MPVTFKKNSQGFKDLLTSPGAQAVLRDKARQIAAAAGDDFGIVHESTGQRQRVYVSATTRKAQRRQENDHALERALGTVSALS